MEFINPIILDNSGDDNYNFVARDWVTTPVMAKFLRIFLSDDSMLQQIMEIRSTSSTGKLDVRSISFGKYPKATDRTNLILLIPLEPPLLLDGNVYFRLSIPALSTVRMMFYFDRKSQANILR